MNDNNPDGLVEIPEIGRLNNMTALKCNKEICNKTLTVKIRLVYNWRNRDNYNNGQKN